MCTGSTLQFPDEERKNLQKVVVLSNIGVLQIEVAVAQFQEVPGPLNANSGDTSLERSKTSFLWQFTHSS